MVALGVLAMFFLSLAAATDEACTVTGGCLQASDLIETEVQAMNVSMLQLSPKAAAGRELDNESALLEMPSSGPTMTFYAYRVQNDQNYLPVNQNMANLAGALWYLHNEIITQLAGGIRAPLCTRRFGKTRLQRFKFTYKPTEPLVKRGLNFGVRSAFDFGENTGDGCTNNAYHDRRHGNEQYKKFGYIVGCQILGNSDQCNFPGCPKDANAAGCTPGKKDEAGMPYPGALWFSVPGYCPERKLSKKKEGLGPRGGNQYCARRAPGGYCKTPTGTRDCTFTYEDAGEISLNELSGVEPKYPDFNTFCHAGCAEYAKAGNRRRRRLTHLNDNGGCGVTFFDDLSNVTRAKGRMKAVTDLFKKKYPDVPTELAEAPCDFDKAKFFRGWLHGY